MLIKKQEGLPQADEQAQEGYNRFVLAGVKAATAASDKLVQYMSQFEGDPAAALTEATMMIVPDIQAKANVPTDALLQGSIEIMKNIAEFGKASETIPTDDATMNRAAQLLVEDLLDEFGSEADFAALMDMVGSTSAEEAEKIGSEQESYANGFDQG